MIPNIKLDHFYVIITYFLYRRSIHLLLKCKILRDTRTLIKYPYSRYYPSLRCVFIRKKRCGVHGKSSPFCFDTDEMSEKLMRCLVYSYFTWHKTSEASRKAEVKKKLRDKVMRESRTVWKHRWSTLLSMQVYTMYMYYFDQFWSLLVCELIETFCCTVLP